MQSLGLAICCLWLILPYSIQKQSGNSQYPDEKYEDDTCRYCKFKVPNYHDSDKESQNFSRNCQTCGSEEYQKVQKMLFEIQSGLKHIEEILSQQKSNIQLNEEKIFIPYPPKSGVTASGENSNVKGSLLEVNQEGNYNICQIKNSDGSCERDLFDSNRILPKSGSYTCYELTLGSNKDESMSSYKGQLLTKSDLLPCPDTSSTSQHKHCPFERKQDTTKKEDNVRRDNVISYNNYQLFPDYPMTTSSQKEYKPSNLPLDEILTGSSQQEENVYETPGSKVSSSEANNLLLPTFPDYSVTTSLQDTSNLSTTQVKPFDAMFMNTFQKRENLDQTPGSKLSSSEANNLLLPTFPDYSVTTSLQDTSNLSTTQVKPSDAMFMNTFQKRENLNQTPGSKLSSSEANKLLLLTFPDYSVTTSLQDTSNLSTIQVKPFDAMFMNTFQKRENLDQTPGSKLSSSEANNLLLLTFPDYSVTTSLQDTSNLSTSQVKPFDAMFMNTFQKRENLNQTPGSNVPSFETKYFLSRTSPDYSANKLSHIKISETTNFPPDTTLTSIYQEGGNQAQMPGSKLSTFEVNNSCTSSTDCSATKLSHQISTSSNLPPDAILMFQEEGNQAEIPGSKLSSFKANNVCTSSTDCSTSKLSQKIPNPSNLHQGIIPMAMSQEGGNQAEMPGSKDRTTTSGTDNYSMYTSQSDNNYSNLSHGTTPTDIVSQERRSVGKYSSPEKNTAYSPTSTNVLNVSPYQESSNSNQRESYPLSTTTVTNSTSPLEEESNSSNRIVRYSSDITPIVGYEPLENKDSNQNMDFFFERNLYEFEDETEFFQLKNGKKIKPSQMVEILMSTKNESANTLTVPYMFSGSLKDYCHVVDSMPKFQNDAFVCTRNNLIVSYKDYCEILNLFGIERKCASNTGVQVNEKYIDSYLIACIIATTNCKEGTAIIMPDKTLVPYSIYSNYIHSLSNSDKETISVVSPCLKPVCYQLYEEVIDTCLNSNNNLPIEKNPEVQLWPTGTKMYLVPFLDVIRSYYHQPSDIIVKLPNGMILPLHNYYAFFDELTPEYKKNCMVHLPNCDSKVPFHIFHEICVNFLQYSITDMKPRNGGFSSTKGFTNCSSLTTPNFNQKCNCEDLTNNSNPITGTILESCTTNKICKSTCPFSNKH